MADYLAGLGCSPEELGRLARIRREIFVMSLGLARPRAAFLTSPSCGLSGEQLKRVVVRFPRILSYAIESVLAPRLAFLEEIGVAKADLPKARACGGQRISLGIFFAQALLSA